jgi:hypothetical protein
MSIFPENDDFNFALSTMQRRGPVNLDDYTIIKISEQKQGLPDGSTKTQPAKYIYFHNKSNVQLKSIIQKIDKFLNSKGHAANIHIIHSILYCYSYIPRNNQNAVDILNRFLSCFTKADINQFVVYPFENYFNYNLRVSKFQVSTFEHDKFERYCQKFKTDFYELHGKNLKGNLAIKKTFETIIVLNLPVVTNFGIENNSDLKEAFWFYFEELSRYYSNEFKYEFVKSQNLMTLYGLGFFDIHEMLKLHPLEITIFLNMGDSRKEGCIIPIISQPHIEFGKSDEKNELLKKSLLTNFGKNILSDIEKNSTVNKFLEFCTKAKRHILHNRISDGFLHYVIAMDLLFGEKDSATNSVSTKVALCSFQALGESYHDALKIIKDLYDIRSRYVHKGEEIKTEKLDKIDEICIIIFETLLRNLKSDFDFGTWVKRLEIVIKKLEVPVDVSEEEYESLGILKNKMVID